MASVKHTEIFDCTVEFFYSLIADYEKYSDFLAEVKSVKVISSSAEYKEVEYNVFLIKNFSYVNKHFEFENKEIRWEFLKGDIFKTMSGSWVLEPHGEGKTKATYSVEATFGMWIPGTITKMLLESNLPAMMRAYHQRIKKLKN